MAGLLFSVLFFLAVCGCANYRIGNQSLYPADVETIYVPVFDSTSFRRDLGERLTEAVIKEIQRRTPYTVVSDPNADSTLTGRIFIENKHLLLETREGDPRESEVGLQVQVSWISRQGNPIHEIPVIPIPADCVNVSATSGLVPEVGQSVATAQQKAIVRLAQQIVSLMEARW